MNINEIINEKYTLLKNKGIDTSKIEIRMMLGSVLGISQTEVCFYKHELTEEQNTKFMSMIEQRARHCPVDKIIGEKGFYKYDFMVDENVLSPRFETESLVEEALLLLQDKKNPKIIEFGVGSGCVILSILAEIKQAKGVGIEISDKSLQIANKNAEKLKVKDKIIFKNISWFDENLLKNIDNDFDMLISNPPYIPTKDIKDLDNEVKNFDPLTALDGGEDGLRDYRQICKIAAKILRKKAYLLFEVGINQDEDVVKIALEQGLKKVKVVKDLTGINRCIILEK